MVVVLMIAVALYTFAKKDLGQQVTRVLNGTDRWKGALFGLVIGAYDGFFGPGTGSFLIFGFVRLFGMDFVRASASAKVINTATNISAISFFASHGPILWQIGLIMAVCNLLGSYLGVRLAHHVIASRDPLAPLDDARLAPCVVGREHVGRQRLRLRRRRRVVAPPVVDFANHVHEVGVGCRASGAGQLRKLRL